LPDNIELEIFELLSNFTDNALKELLKQKNGLLRIEFRNADESISIKIANTLKTALEIESIYSNEQKDGQGYGLKRVREIIEQQPNLKHFTYKEGFFAEQEVFVQQIVITTEGDW
jgi:sensor histidine kinase YesM